MKIYKHLIIMSLIFVPMFALAQDNGPIEAIPEEGLRIPVSRGNEKASIEFVSTNASTKRLLGDIEVVLVSENNTKYEFKISDPPEVSTKVNIPQAKYKIRASRKGYEDFSDEIDTTSDSSKYLIALNPLPKTPEPKSNINTRTTNIYPYGTYSPNYYDLTSTNNRTIPFGLNTQRIISGSGNPRLSPMISRFPYDFTDPAISSPSANHNNSLYGCLEPGQQYYLSYYDTYHNQFSRPYPFTTPQSGPYSISVPTIDYSRGSLDIPSYNPNQTSTYLNSYRCPNFPYSNQLNTYNQNYQYGQNQLPYQEDIDINKYFQVIFSPSDGNYYLVNKQNKFDYRKISFVDRGDGEGGFAFFPSEYSGNSDWYVAIYKRNNDGDVSIDLDLASQSKIKPTEYARMLNSEVVESFNEM